MATIPLTESTFNETVSGNDIVLIDFWAAWCGPCRMFGPIYEKSSEQHPDITFAKVDTEAEQGLSSHFRITSIPTLMAIREGVVLFSQPGALPPQALEQVIAAVRAVDMGEIRTQLAEQDGQSRDQAV